MCEKHGLELFWKKTDLKHTVEPDDVFAIKREGKIAYYFFEFGEQAEVIQGTAQKSARQ